METNSFGSFQRRVSGHLWITHVQMFLEIKWHILSFYLLAFPPVPLDCILPSARTNQHNKLGAQHPRRLSEPLSKVLFSAPSHVERTEKEQKLARSHHLRTIRQPLVRSGAAICHRRQIPKGEQDGTDKENSTVGGYKRSSFKGSFTFSQAATAHSESRSVMDPSLPTSLRHPPLTSLCNWAGSPPR